MVRVLVLSFAAILLPLTLTSVSGHVGGSIAPIYELPTADLPDLTDGTIADWEEALPGLFLTHADFANSIGTGMDPSDIAVGVHLAWHHATQRIYVAIQRVDDVYETDDNTTFMLDGDHSGGRFQNFSDDVYSEDQRRRLQFSQAQLYFPVPTLEISLASMGPLWQVQLPWSEAGAFFRLNPGFPTQECEYVTGS